MRMQEQMKKRAVLLAVVVALGSNLGDLAGGKLAIAQDYCPAGGSSCDWEYVGGVEVGDISNLSGCSSYTDYTSLSTTMEIGQGYPITITNGYPFNGDDHCGCWVDWNGDKNFDDAGEAISLSVGEQTPGGGIETFVGTITPPVDANGGQTRLRVRVVWWDTPYPCDFTTYGEVEDYTITLPGPEPKYSGGDGSAGYPYRIATAEDLNDIGAHPEDWDEHFVLMNDIDLSEYTGAEFNVIGYYHTEVNNAAFTGSFDGNSHTISNFTHVGGPYISYLALFGYVGSGGEITDVGIVNYNVGVGGNGTAPLVARLTGGQVERCWSSSGTIEGNFRSGGLVGQVSSGTVSRCFATGGQIFAMYNFSGGLVGESGGSILDCYSTCSAGGGSAFYYGGGLVGYNHGGSVANCYSTGSVSGNDLGGLVGYNTGTVVDSFWDIETSGIGTSDGGTGLDTEQMQTAGTYIDAGWDFATPMWTICEGKTYAHLWYEYLVCEKYSGGDGSAGYPYRIATAEDLNDIGAHPEDWDKHFEMIADIDLGSYTGDSFNVIGTASEPFFGVFDGNNHKIYNFDYESQGDGCVGLFGTVGDEEKFPLPGEGPLVDLQPVIENIRLVSPTVSGSCGGSLIAFLERGSCLNCYATDVNVTVLSSGGGLIGGVTDPNSVMNCFVSGKVSGGDLVGGFTGSLSGGVNRCAAVCDVVGYNRVGGLIGHSAGTGVHYCYSRSNVTGNEDVGGLTGSSGWGTIDDCYSVGSVYGNSRVGGLSGDLYECDVLRCYAACEITNVGGGLVGRGTDSSVSASFWDVEVSGKTGSAAGTGKTTEQMQMMSTYTDAGWDFVDNWDICEGTNYPRLIWQIPAWDFLCPDGVDGIDYAYLSGHWQDTNCAAANDCDGADLDFSGVVDWADLKILCGQWLEGTP